MFNVDNEKFDELLSRHAHNNTLELIEMEDSDRQEVMLSHPTEDYAIVSGATAAIKLAGFIGISTPMPG